jgi:hypothetical protein
MKLLKPTTTMVKGVAKKVFPDPSKVEGVFFGSFRTFGGTEQFSNEVYTILATATVDTWFNPEIKADCQIYLCDTGETYQIISQPENIDVRHQYMQFKVEKVGGKA